ncbi:MAG TPA: NAD-dependent epimerase/dehydratase family protein [Candidatus Binatia bacterium]|nr:NAD-dependent epimerase/dehydratase family protein [Candidatus Binatia bacterium]
MLVTGGAGFIGSHLTEALLRRGDRVVVLDNFDPFYDPAIKRGNLAGLVNAPRFTLIEGDLLSDDDLERTFATAQYDAVIHLAARAGVRPSLADPELYDRINVLGTTRLLQRVRSHRVGHLVFGSSSSVYGSTTPVPFREDQAADRPSSPYAATKRAGELACYAFHELYGVPVTCLRLFTVYGPRQRPEMAIHRFTRLLAAGKTVPVFGNGSARRDFTYVDDIVAGILAAVDHPSGYRVYNLGTTQTTRLDDLVHLIADALGVSLRMRLAPAMAGDVPITYADISRARQDLGYRPLTSIEAGIEAFISWFQKQSLASAA